MWDLFLIKVCRKLSKKEWKFFECLVNLFYFNIDKIVICLFEILKKDYLEFDSFCCLKKELVYVKFFNDKLEYDKNWIYLIMFNFKGLIDILII